MEERAEIDGLKPTKEIKKPRIPRWQKGLTEDDYKQVLKIVSERTDKNELDKAMNNIAFRLEGAEMGGVLPPEGWPTFVARGEFIDIKEGELYLHGRINALRGVASKYGKASGNKQILKYRNSTFENIKDEESLDNTDIVFTTTTKFEQGIVSVKMTKEGKFSVNVDFPQGKWEENTPTYNSGFLPAKNLTEEEVNVLARHSIEVGYYNIYGDPTKSPYPWELPPPENTSNQ
jgi:hypothetical protein